MFLVHLILVVVVTGVPGLNRWAINARVAPAGLAGIVVLSQLVIVVAGVPGLNRWAVNARVVIDVEGFFDHEVLAA